MSRTVRRAGVAALLAVLSSMAGTAAAQQKPAVTTPKPAVPFIEDNYAKALADAQKRNVKMFVDLWAPW